MSISVSNGKFLESNDVYPYPVARRGSSTDSYPLSTLVSERMSTNIVRGISPNDGSFIYNDVNVLTGSDESELIFFIYGYFFKTTVRALFELCNKFIPISTSTAYVHACIKVDKPESGFWELTKIENSETSGSDNTLDYDGNFIGLTFVLDQSNDDLSDDTYKSLCLVKIEQSGQESIFTINESTKYSYFALTQPYILCEAKAILSNRLNEIPAIGNDAYTQRKLWVQLNYDSSGSAVLRYYYNNRWQIIGSIYK